MNGASIVPAGAKVQELPTVQLDLLRVDFQDLVQRQE